MKTAFALCVTALALAAAWSAPAVAQTRYTPLELMEPNPQGNWPRYHQPGEISHPRGDYRR